MGKLGGFLELHRVGFDKRDPRERVGDYKHYFEVQPEPVLREQSGRCMDCGVPFCHDGCPLGNLIPDWNDLVYGGRWREALEQLHATNNFPEFTGRICPAPCESACVLAINDDPVTIEQIELGIAERGWEEGWITPQPPERRTGRSVGVVGSGPAGLAVAAELNARGHHVVVYEKDEGPGGLMRFGVPDAKLEKHVIDRRVAVLEQEGVEVRCDVEVGVDVAVVELRARHDALVVAIGSRVGRPLEVPGVQAAGVHAAMDYLYQRNRAVAALEGRAHRAPAPGAEITAAGKRVVVIGGGDTAMDCVSNAHREGAAEVLLLDVYPELTGGARAGNESWPEPPRRTGTTYALEEGGERRWASQITEVVAGPDGRVRAVRGRRVEGTSSRDLRPVAGSEFELEADLVLVAIGFLHPEHEGLLSELELELDRGGNVKAGAYASSREGVFAAGDARMGQSLVVWAITEGRRCARVVDRFLGDLGPAPALEHEEAASPSSSVVVGPPDASFGTGDAGESAALA